MVYIKPLPSYLLNFDFWQENLLSSPEDIFEGALGLLSSYTWLIRWESDIKVARSHSLIDSGISFKKWMTFRRSFISNFDRNKLSHDVLKWRYDFAELRLKRINLIWRLRPRWPYDLTTVVREYQSPYRMCSSFFEQNFQPVLVSFVYLTVVLTAMQLGLATDKLHLSEDFQQASVTFAVFCALLPLFILGIVLVLCVFLFFFHLWKTSRHLQKVRDEIYATSSSLEKYRHQS